MLRIPCNEGYKIEYLFDKIGPRMNEKLMLKIGLKETHTCYVVEVELQESHIVLGCVLW